MHDCHHERKEKGESVSVGSGRSIKIVHAEGRVDKTALLLPFRCVALFRVR